MKEPCLLCNERFTCQGSACLHCPKHCKQALLCDYCTACEHKNACDGKRAFECQKANKQLLDFIKKP